MPTRPPHLCTRCRQPTTGRCPRCDQPWARKPQSWRDGTTGRWRNLRASKLRTDPICQHDQCLRLATVVDHIVPISQGGQRYDWTNLQGLCEKHHAEKTHAESRRRIER